MDNEENIIRIKLKTSKAGVKFFVGLTCQTLQIIEKYMRPDYKAMLVILFAECT